MKYTVICILFFITACNTNQTEKELSGIYTSFHEHEFGKTDDTLIVFKATSGEGMYKISRQTGLIKIVHGKKIPKELHTEVWTLEYDADKQTLFDVQKGRTLVWNKGTHRLQWGNTVYKKLAGQ